MDFKDFKVLITGGSSGIGLELVKAFAEKGVIKFALLARNVERMKEVQSSFPNLEIHILQADLSKPQELKQAIVSLSDKWQRIDLLINNAGVVSAGLLEDVSDEDIVQQININLTGLILLTKYSLPLLKNSKSPGIINISSGLGLIAWPFYSVYAATKAAVRQFSDAIQRENPDFHILTVYPTATDTPMMTSAQSGNMDDPSMVAEETVRAYLSRNRSLIFGGDQRKVDVLTNFHLPEILDKKAAERYDALKERAEKHRSM